MNENPIVQQLIDFFTGKSQFMVNFLTQHRGDVSALVTSIQQGTPIIPNPNVHTASTPAELYRSVWNFAVTRLYNPAVATNFPLSPGDFRSGAIRELGIQCDMLGSDQPGCTDHGVAAANAISDLYDKAFASRDTTALPEPPAN